MMAATALARTASEVWVANSDHTSVMAAPAASSPSHHQITRTTGQIRTAVQQIAPAITPQAMPISRDRTGWVHCDAATVAMPPTKMAARTNARRALRAEFRCTRVSITVTVPFRPRVRLDLPIDVQPPYEAPRVASGCVGGHETGSHRKIWQYRPRASTRTQARLCQDMRHPPNAGHVPNQSVGFSSWMLLVQMHQVGQSQTT
jgi:hypothetical protein